MERHLSKWIHSTLQFRFEFGWLSWTLWDCLGPFEDPDIFETLLLLEHLAVLIIDIRLASDPPFIDLNVFQHAQQRPDDASSNGHPPLILFPLSPHVIIWPGVWRSSWMNREYEKQNDADWWNPGWQMVGLIGLGPWVPMVGELAGASWHHCSC